MKNRQRHIPAQLLQAVHAQARKPVPCGFTLVEVLLAIGILGMGLSMIAAIFPVAAKEARAPPTPPWAP